MTRYLLDTGIASDFVNRRLGVDKRAREAVAQGHRIGINTPVLGELWAGIDLSQTRERNEKLLKRRLAGVILWPYDKAAARVYGQLFADLRRMGRPMQQIDIQIAAVAFTLRNCTVVSKDSDLSAVPGLTVVDWTK